MLEVVDLGKPGDFHVHLRDGPMKELVTPTLRRGGVSVCYVMPNLVPPIIEPEAAVEYRQSLQKIDSRTTYLMSLYLHPSTTPDTIRRAARSNITGVKCYPAGVTTNSDHGIASYEPFYPVFAEMEKQNMVLNLHGECPSGGDVHLLNAEESFLPTLQTLHTKFPGLRIILEHCTSAAAVEAVKKCGPTVAATITAHHLYLTVDSWGGNSHNFCKPVAKMPSDRQALIDAATSGNPKFFFGSDSAPHPIQAKEKGKGASAGVFTQTDAIPLVAELFDSLGKLDKLKGFVTDFGSSYYGVNWNDLNSATVKLVKTPHVIDDRIRNGEGLEVVPFKAGEELHWSVEWSS